MKKILLIIIFIGLLASSTVFASSNPYNSKYGAGFVGYDNW